MTLAQGVQHVENLHHNKVVQNYEGLVAIELFVVRERGLQEVIDPMTQELPLRRQGAGTPQEARRH